MAEAGTLDSVKNVVFVLADDLDWNLFQQVPRLAALQDKGMTFTNHTVTDSLCCPSRTSILRGQYIHNHDVVSNLSTTGGGWPTFRDKGWHTDCLPTWLQSAGVQTALFGKYLNEYPATQRPASAKYVPPGWDSWGVPTSRGDSYTGYDYVLNSNGRLVRYGKKPTDFLNDVITTKATDFIRTAPRRLLRHAVDVQPAQAGTRRPAQQGDASGDRRAPHPQLQRRSARTSRPGSRAVPPIPAWKQTRLDQLWRQRAQSAESVADSVDAVLATLAETGRADDTLVVVTSDNGYHVGTHRLTKGKRTAFREDTVVPDDRHRPRRHAGCPHRRDDLDDRPRSDLHDPPGRAGTGLGRRPVAHRHDRHGRGARDLAPGHRLGEPRHLGARAIPTTSPRRHRSTRRCARQQWLFVVYRDGERELYDLAADPYEMNNIIATADTGLVASLYSQLQALRVCSGDTCRTADAIVMPGPAT